ncbi:MAG: 2-phosphosulfolactate phosphatase [Ilumatobacteraceae bacterium]|nr:2-phosphosulfolactate phosphatase [Ilumatobacteraceae bacterium]
MPGADAEFRFEWGPNGLRTLAPDAAVVVIVDVLRFTTAVSAAVEAGAEVLPYRWADGEAGAYAAEHGAVVAGRREDGGPSLSPTDLLQVPAGTRVVLPSPNGSALAFAAREHGAGHVLAGCFRNASATAARALELADGGPIAVIAAGERWRNETGPLRPAVEDLLGAGAVLAALDPSAAVGRPRCSAEAAAARAAFLAARPLLHDALLDSQSGRQLAARGWLDDIQTSSSLDVTDRAAELVGPAFKNPSRP